jgi:hypothetical protein
MVSQFDLYMAREHPEEMGLIRRARAPSEVHVDLLSSYLEGKKGVLSNVPPSRVGLDAYVAVEQARMAGANERRKDFMELGRSAASGAWDVVKTGGKGFVETGLALLDRKLDYIDREEANLACLRQYGVPARVVSEILARVKPKNVPQYLEIMSGRAERIRNEMLAQYGVTPEIIENHRRSLNKKQFRAWYEGMVMAADARRAAGIPVAGAVPSLPEIEQAVANYIGAHDKLGIDNPVKQFIGERAYARAHARSYESGIDAISTPEEMDRDWIEARNDTIRETASALGGSRIFNKAYVLPVGNLNEIISTLS